MNKNSRKGFTLVELLFVIAILAALSTIGIIGFKSIKNKANLGSDTAEVDILNRYANSYVVINDATTTSDVAEYLLNTEGKGIDLNTIQPLSAGYRFGFDISTDKFCLIDADNNLVDYTTENKCNVQAFVNTSADVVALTNAGYSVYMQRANYSVTEYENLKCGVDTGVNDEIEKLTYVGTGSNQNVVFHTCSENTTLVINDTSADSEIRHYGVAGYLNIIKCSTHSYYEFGYVPAGEIQSGRLVNEEGTVTNEYDTEVPVGVQFLYINSSKTEQNAFDEIVLATEGAEAELPTLKRDPVAIGESGTLVVKLEEVNNSTVTNEEYVYLFKSGISDQIVTSTQKLDTISGSIVAGTVKGHVDGEEVNVTVKTININDEEHRDAASQLANIAAEAVTDADLDKSDITVETPVAKETIIDSYQYFGGHGTGTEADPFKVYDYASLQHITDMYDKFCYYEVDAELSNGFINCAEGGKSWKPVYLNGNFDGNGVTIYNCDGAFFQVVGASADVDEDGANIVIKDFTITINTTNGSGFVRNLANAGTTTFEEVTLHGRVEGEYNVAAWINYGTRNTSEHGADYTVVWKNCVNDCDVVCTTGNVEAGFFAHTYVDDSTEDHKAHFEFVNTTYTGTLYSNTGKNCGNTYFGITGNYNENIGSIKVNGNTLAKEDYDTFNCKYENTQVYANVAATMNKSLGENNRKYFVEKQANVATITVTVCGQLTAYDDVGNKVPGETNITMRYSTETITTSETGSIKVFDKIEEVQIVLDADEYKSELVGTTLYIYLATATNYAEGTIRLQVNQYDAAGGIVSAGTTDLATLKYNKSWNICGTIVD